ncbi:MAG: hypothetical protein V4717_16825 [Bacteroidota bacterium]
MINNAGIRICFLSIGFFCLLATSVSAQKTDDPSKKNKKEKQAERKERVDKLIRQEEEGALIYQKQSIFGAKLYSDGWGAFFEKGYMKTVNKTNLFSIEIGERKHRKEEKVSKFISGTPFLGNSLVYGKQNNFYFLKLGVGQSYLLGGKGNRNGVAVSAIYVGGLSMGFLKPYYLDVIDPLSNSELTIRYEGNGSRNDTLFLDPQSISGGAGVFKGFNQMKVKPGLFLKGAIRFDYGRYNELVSALEAGFNTEFYSADMPIMVNNKARKLFTNVFIAIEFGRRK